MILVHASADNGALLLWGETAAGTRAHRRGGKSAPFSPTNAGAARIAAALAEVVPQAAPRDSDIETHILWLPSVKDQPLPSSALIGPSPENKTRPVLAPWSITALRLSAAQAVDLLCACIGRDTLGPGVVIGGTLAYWCHVLRFAGALTAREQFLPSLRAEGESYRAYWMPVLSGTDSQRLRHLAEIMPAACRAVAVADAPPERPALAVVTEVVENLVDALVRSTASPRAPVALTARSTVRPSERPENADVRQHS